METILKIDEATFGLKSPESSWEQNYDGFLVTTDRQVIKIGVTNDQNCCESWGYFVSEDDPSPFVGASLLGVEVVDTELRVGLATKHGADYLDEGDIMFVNLLTDRGVLQFAAYNGHNGYYGHTGIVLSEQLTHEKDL